MDFWAKGYHWAHLGYLLFFFVLRNYLWFRCCFLCRDLKSALVSSLFWHFVKIGELRIWSRSQSCFICLDFCFSGWLCAHYMDRSEALSHDFSAHTWEWEISRVVFLLYFQIFSRTWSIRA
jgi:hypothetical protein